MATIRKFTDFNPDDRGGLGLAQVPPDGFCIAAFLVITEENSSRSVLMGKMNPDANWDHIGALDSERIRRHSTTWMLPSSHLMLFESPEDAARRIVIEQLETRLDLSQPIIVSDVRTLKRNPEAKHWDLDFVYRVISSRDKFKPTKAWKEICFVDVDKVPRDQITQLHMDIIGHAL